jgi:serine/threonine protein kinase
MISSAPQIKLIFGQALDIETPLDRAAFLTEVCQGDAALRADVEEMLRAHEEAGRFLDPDGVRPSKAAGQGESSERSGTMIGPYKLLEQIGEGGMGLVFMAEQTSPVRRKVALKVLKPGMDTRQVVARFEAERQALALMDHHHIAKIHDAGTTASGRPYFVMELVRGVPITDFCDQRRYTTRQRLELFVLVSQAIQHAHQRGIIHRDLKPGNVLVTLHDTVAVPKVIDFGIAKATTGPLTERTLFTHFAQMIGTPLYMSPEQAEMNGLDVDTRSDVYSLGVLLYELLTGTTPFTNETLRRAGLDEMRRLIREEEPPMPSQRLNTLDAQSCSTVSERRGVDGRRLGQLLRGELDWIVMRALEKDRNRRYESASTFAADVQRHLNDEAVAACPPSARYRLRKFWRRNRRPLATVGVIAAVLVAATAVSTWQAVVAREAQRRAEADRDRAEVAQQKSEAAERHAATEAAIARKVNRFLQEDVLRQADRSSGPDALHTRNLTVREALDRAAGKIGERFRAEPLVEAAIRSAIGQAYHSIGAEQLAVPHLERAATLRDTHLGPEDHDTLQSMLSLVNIYSWVGRHKDAITLIYKLLENRKARLGPDHPETVACLSRLAETCFMAGEWEKSACLREQLLEKRRTISGPTHPDTIGAMLALAHTYQNMARLEESIALYETVLDHLRTTTYPEGQAGCKFNLGIVCQRAGQLDHAERLFREVLPIVRKRGATCNERLGTANTLAWLARTLLLQERYAEAEPLFREALEIFEKEEPQNQRRFYWMSQLGAVLLGQQRYAQAESLLLQGYEGMKQREAILPANEKPRLAEAGERLVCFYEMTNQSEKARAWRQQVIAKSSEAASAGAK